MKVQVHIGEAEVSAVMAKIGNSTHKIWMADFVCVVQQHMVALQNVWLFHRVIHTAAV